MYRSPATARPLTVLLAGIVWASALSAQEIRRFDRLAIASLSELLQTELGDDLQIPALGAALPDGGFELRDVTVTIFTDRPVSFTVAATSTVLESTTSVLMSLIRPDGGPPLVLMALRPRRLGLGQLFPGTSAGGSSFPAAVLTVVWRAGPESAELAAIPASVLPDTVRGFYREALGSSDFILAIDRGVGLNATWPLANLPSAALRTLGVDSAGEVLLEGGLGMALGELISGGGGAGRAYLRATLPTPARPPRGFPPWLEAVRLTDLTLELAHLRPEVVARMAAKMEARLDGRSRRLAGSTVFALGRGQTEFTFAAALEDAWERPFGVGWLTLENVGLLLSFDSAGNSRGEVYGSFGLGGGRVETRLEVGGSAAAPSARFEGRVDRVSPADLAELLRQHARNPSVGLGLPPDLVELRDVELAFAAGASASLGISAKTDLEVELDGRPRRFLASTELLLAGGAVSGTLEATLDGSWDRPFGVQWLTLEEVGLSLAVGGGARDPLLDGTLHSSFELGRDTRIDLEIRISDGPDGRSARLVGSVNELSTRDLGELARRQLDVSPFAGSALDLAFRDVTMTLEAGTRQAFSIAGSTTFRGREAQLLLTAATSGGQRQIVTGLRIEDWSLSDAAPALAGSIVEQLRLESAAVLLTRATGRLRSTDLSPEAYAFFRALQPEDEFTLSLEPGVSLVGVLPLPASSPLGPALEVLGSRADQVTVTGTLPGAVLGLGEGGALSLRASLPPMSPRLPNGTRPPWFRSGQLAFFIEAGPGGAAAGLDGTLDVTIDETDLSFTVAGEFGGPPVAVTLSGRLTAEEPWVAPFDVEWLTLRELGAALSFNPVSLSLGLGFSGDADLGTKNLEVDVGLALNVATGVPTNFVFRGASSTAFGISDLVALQGQLAAAAGRTARIPVERVPNIEIRPVDAETPIEVLFALFPSEDVNQGLALRGALYTALSQAAPPEQLAVVDAEIATSGIMIFGSVPRSLGVGGLTLDRPLVDLDLIAFPPAASFVLTGDVVLPWFTRRVDVSLGREADVSAAITRVTDTVAAFQAFSEAFQDDPVAAIEGSLTGDRGLFAVAAASPPPWLNDLFGAVGRARELFSDADPRTLLAHALAGTEVTVPAGSGFPAGGRDPLGCALRRTLFEGRCWDVVPFAGEEIAFTQLCATGALEAGRCWLTRPSATSTRPRVTRRVCVERNRANVCTRRANRRVCPADTAEAGGRCYARPPGPPREALPATPARACAGRQVDGRCYELGQAPRAGRPTGGADPGCPLATPVPVAGRCWRVPPTPSVQAVEIEGICRAAGIDCTVDGLLTETISPLIGDAVDELLAPLESRR